MNKIIKTLLFFLTLLLLGCNRPVKKTLTAPIDEQIQIELTNDNDSISEESIDESEIKSANENVKKFMQENNMEFPYNIGTNITESYYSGYTEEWHLENSELTDAQKDILNRFFEKLTLINDPEYFIGLKNHIYGYIVPFSIDRVTLGNAVNFCDEIYVLINYYYDEHINGADDMRYDNELDLWSEKTVAIYSIDDFVLTGWER